MSCWRRAGGRQLACALAVPSVLLAAAVPARADEAERAGDAKPAIASVFAYGSVSFVELGPRDRTWTLTGAGAAFNASDSGVVIAEVQNVTRPGLANQRGALRYDEQISARTSVYVQFSASTGDPLREDWGIAAGGAQRVSDQLQLTLDARAARYSTPDPAAPRPSFTGLAINPGVIFSPRGTPLELSAQAIVLRDDRKDWRAGAAVRALYYTGDRDFWMAGASRYPENELGIVRQLTSGYVGVRRDLGQGIGLRITAEYARLERAWTSRTLSLSLEKRF